MKARRLNKSSLEALLLYGICVCVITFLVVKGVRENFEWLDAFGLCVVTYFACRYRKEYAEWKGDRFWKVKKAEDANE